MGQQAQPGLPSPDVCQRSSIRTCSLSIPDRLLYENLIEKCKLDAKKMLGLANFVLTNFARPQISSETSFSRTWKMPIGRKNEDAKKLPKQNLRDPK